MFLLRYFIGLSTDRNLEMHFGQFFYHFVCAKILHHKFQVTTQAFWKSWQTNSAMKEAKKTECSHVMKHIIELMECYWELFDEEFMFQ